MSLASEQAQFAAAAKQSGIPMVDQFNQMTMQQRMQFAQALGAAGMTPVGMDAAHPENAPQLELLQYLTRQPPVQRISLLGVHKIDCVMIKKESGRLVEVPVADFDPAKHQLASETKQPADARAHLPKLRKRIKEHAAMLAAEQEEADEFSAGPDDDDDGDDSDDEGPDQTTTQTKPKAKNSRKRPKLRREE